MDMLYQKDTLALHVSMLYVADTPNIVDKRCKIGLQKHPGLGMLLSDDLRMACDASKISVIMSTN